MQKVIELENRIRDTASRSWDDSGNDENMVLTWRLILDDIDQVFSPPHREKLYRFAVKQLSEKLT